MRRVGMKLLLLVALFAACAPISTHYTLVEKRLAAHDPVAADAVIEKEKEQYGSNNRLLYFLDRGLSLSLAGKFDESNRHLDSAAQIADDLYTESITRHGAALLTNDNILPYGGEDFERVLIHLISALNYAQMHRPEEALVECRRMDTQLNRINDRYQDTKNRYREDAFARYIAGMLYEAQGEMNDAFLSYRKAFEIYGDWAKTYKIPAPRMVGGDLMRTMKALGMESEYKTYETLLPVATPPPHTAPSAGGGEIVVVSMHGRSPYKEDLFFDMVINKDLFTSIRNTAIWQAYAGSGNVPVSLIGQLVRVALPRYVPQKSRVIQANVSVSGRASFFASSVLMEDITAIATANLEDRIQRTQIKAMARAAIKAVAVRKTSKRAESEVGGIGGFALGKVAEALAATTEVADKRSWRTLPDEIHITRIIVPPGDYQVMAEFIGSDGAPLDTAIPQPVSIGIGEQRLLVVRTIH